MNPNSHKKYNLSNQLAPQFAYDSNLPITNTASQNQLQSLQDICDFSSATIPKTNIRPNDFVVEKFAMNGGLESMQNTDNSMRENKNEVIKVQDDSYMADVNANVVIFENSPQNEEVISISQVKSTDGMIPSDENADVEHSSSYENNDDEQNDQEDEEE